MDNNLITIDKLITQTGTTKTHLAYLTKLGILPNAVKRKINGAIIGCYPQDSVNKIAEIQQMKNQGITYSQISKTTPTSIKTLKQVQGDTEFLIKIKPSNFAYLTLGLIIGILVSTLNTSGLAAMKQANNIELNDKSGVYLIKVPKQNLDKLERTNINYLINN